MVLKRATFKQIRTLTTSYVRVNVGIRTIVYIFCVFFSIVSFTSKMQILLVVRIIKILQL